MNDQLTIKQATRQGVNPLIGLYAESGCGKTLSSLLLARGLAGETGKLCLVDSESGRGSLFADVIPGSYKTIDLEPPFSPQRYIQAIDLVEKEGYAVGIIDSASHEWEGMGGVCEMASDNEAKSGKAGLHNWKGPKLEHQKFVLRLMRSKIPWIVCIRAKCKTHQIREGGFTKIQKDDFPSPVQAEDFIYELTAYAIIRPDHSIDLKKCSHPDLKACFPESGPIKIEHGKKIAAWCQSAGKPVDFSKPQTTVQPSVKATAEYRTRMLNVLLAEMTTDHVIAYAESKQIIAVGESLDTWPLDKVPTDKPSMELLKKQIADWGNV